MSNAATLPAPRNRGGRPATGQRENVVEVTLFDTERDGLDALLRLRGKGSRGRATLLRELLLREMTEAGIDPRTVTAVEVAA